MYLPAIHRDAATHLVLVVALCISAAQLAMATPASDGQMAAWTDAYTDDDAAAHAEVVTAAAVPRWFDDGWTNKPASYGQSPLLGQPRLVAGTRLSRGPPLLSS